MSQCLWTLGNLKTLNEVLEQWFLTRFYPKICETWCRVIAPPIFLWFSLIVWKVLETCEKLHQTSRGYKPAYSLQIWFGCFVQMLQSHTLEHDTFYLVHVLNLFHFFSAITPWCMAKLRKISRLAKTLPCSIIPHSNGFSYSLLQCTKNNEVMELFAAIICLEVSLQKKVNLFIFHFYIIPDLSKLEIY